MSEQSPQPNSDQHPYLEQFPNAVQDPEKARILAEVTKSHEEDAIMYRDKALEASKSAARSAEYASELYDREKTQSE